MSHPEQFDEHPFSLPQAWEPGDSAVFVVQDVETPETAGWRAWHNQGTSQYEVREVWQLLVYSASEGALSGNVYKLHCLLVDADMLTSDSQLLLDVIKYIYSSTN